MFEQSQDEEAQAQAVSRQQILDSASSIEYLEQVGEPVLFLPENTKNRKSNKILHSDKIKLRSFFTTLYFAGELGVRSPKHMNTLLSILGIIFGILSIVVTWHYSTRNRRLRRKAKEHREQIDTLNKYSKGTGYKHILHDSFLAISYALGVSLVALSLMVILPSLVGSPKFLRFISLFAAGVHGGAGLVLLGTYRTLAKAKDAAPQISVLEKRIEDIERKLSE